MVFTQYIRPMPKYIKYNTENLAKSKSQEMFEGHPDSVTKYLFEWIVDSTSKKSALVIGDKFSDKDSLRKIRDVKYISKLRNQVVLESLPINWFTKNKKDA